MTPTDRALIAACRGSWRIYKHANFPVQVNGLRIRLLDGIGLRNLEYADPLFASIIRLAFILKPGGCAVDVGANVGRFLLNLVQFDRSVPYVGFEPLPIAAAYVRRLIADNRLTNHQVLAIGLSDHHGSMLLHSGSEYDVSATLAPDMREETYPIRQTVAVSTGDEQLASTPVSLIKVDCEGAEPQVLRGLGQTIHTHRPIVLFEVMRFQHLQGQEIGRVRRDSAEQLARFFRDQAYRFYHCSENGHRDGVTSLDPGPEKGLDANYLAVPDECDAEVGT